METQSMLPVGTLLQGGKYRIERYLSSGGFGNTYVANIVEFDEEVAVKEFYMKGVNERGDDSVTVTVGVRSNTDQFTGQREKFKKEARRLRKLKHPHIVPVHDLFEENGTAYYVMDLIRGESVADRMKRMGQPLTEQETVAILTQVLDALSVVHNQGMYHLDIKPANIMMDADGCAKLIDFGASKQMHAGEGVSLFTSSAMTYTPGYAPLEQQEQNAKNLGPWTDIYALGATLYKMLTNQTPPSASELLVARDPLSYPPAVSQQMRDLIAWMMKPRFDERPQSIGEVKRNLDSLNSLTPSPSPREKGVNTSRVDEETKVVAPQPKPQDEETELVKPMEEQKPVRPEPDVVTPEQNGGNGKFLNIARGWWLLFGIIVLLLVLGGMGYYGTLKKQNLSEQKPMLEQCPESNEDEVSQKIAVFKEILKMEDLKFAQVDDIYSFYQQNVGKIKELDADFCKRIEDYKRVCDVLKNNAFESIRMDVHEDKLYIDQKHRMRMFNYFIGTVDKSGKTNVYSNSDRDKRKIQFANNYKSITSFADLIYTPDVDEPPQTRPITQHQTPIPPRPTTRTQPPVQRSPVNPPVNSNHDDRD